MQNSDIKNIKLSEKAQTQQQPTRKSFQTQQKHRFQMEENLYSIILEDLQTKKN